MSAEALADGQANGAGLADIVAEARPATAFAIKRKLRIDVEQVVHVGGYVEAAVPSQAQGCIDQGVGRQSQ